MKAVRRKRMNNEISGALRAVSMCKCGKKAEYIKDYWVTETKTLKEKDNENVHSRTVESVCGILRRRYCPSCLSKIALTQKSANSRINAKILIAVLMPLILGCALAVLTYIIVNDPSAIRTAIIFGGFTLVAAIGLPVLFSITQSKRSQIAKGDFSNIKALDSILDSLNFGLEEPKLVKELNSVDVLVDGDGNVNHECERSGFYMKVIHNGRIGFEAMRQRMIYPFKDDAETVKRAYVNAQLLEENIRSFDIKELTAEDFDVRNDELMRYSGLSVEVTIPENVTKIADQAFKKSRNCEKIIIPAGVTEIGKEAFAYCPATEIPLPAGIKKIRAFTFYFSALTRIVIPEGVEEIEDNAFGECHNLESVVIPSSCKKIGEAAFKGCNSLVDVELGEGVESVGDYCFNGCSAISRIELPDGCCEIGNFCFEGCKELTAVLIPDTIQFVGGRVFEGATKMSIVGKEGSYAEKLAEELRVRFTPITESKFKKQHGARKI